MIFLSDEINLYHNADKSQLSSTASATDLPNFKLREVISNNVSLKLNNVTTLEISKCDITEISNGIQALKLRQLVLSHNKLTEVPSCIYSALENLQILDLSHNLIKNFDIEPAAYLRLEKIDISYNKIYNFPQWILATPCPKLVQVCYSHNFLTDLHVTRDLAIENLEMCNCNMNDSDFLFLKRLKQIKCLNIGNEKSSKNENFFKEINELFVTVNWKHLDTLQLNNIMLSIFPKELVRLNSLKHLTLINCDLNWIPDDVYYLENLETLDVSNNAICSLPTKLCSLEKLLIVKAPFNYISKIGGEFSHLEVLDLYSNQLDSFKFDLNHFDLIDLERNAIETIEFDFDLYEQKKNGLRNRFDCESRSDGQLIVESTDYDEEERSKSSSSSSLDIESNEYQNNLVDESWDSVEDIPKFVEKNPQITDSDNEWLGHEEMVCQRKRNVTWIPYDVNEDWIFADAD